MLVMLMHLLLLRHAANAIHVDFIISDARTAFDTCGCGGASWDTSCRVHLHNVVVVPRGKLRDCKYKASQIDFEFQVYIISYELCFILYFY